LRSIRRDGALLETKAQTLTWLGPLLDGAEHSLRPLLRWQPITRPLGRGPAARGLAVGALPRLGFSTLFRRQIIIDPHCTVLTMKPMLNPANQASLGFPRMSFNPRRLPSSKASGHAARGRGAARWPQDFGGYRSSGAPCHFEERFGRFRMERTASQKLVRARLSKPFSKSFAARLARSPASRRHSTKVLVGDGVKARTVPSVLRRITVRPLRALPRRVLYIEHGSRGLPTSRGAASYHSLDFSAAMVVLSID
jgi:hypothetical protein